MQYLINHQTIYSYSHPIYLKPHLLRLHPRGNGSIQLLNFSLSVTPSPTGISHCIDLDGNNTIKLWFAQTTQQLYLQTTAEVKTNCSNPFNYLLEPWAIALPLDYPNSLLQQLQPYLQPYGMAIDPIALELAEELLFEVKNNTLDFLFTLNQRIYQDCTYIIRETGAPYPPGITWRNKQGSCRDYAVLFIEVCRSVGMAARFVSGYQEGDEAQQARDLHGWVEVYLPGAGWRGYDPTLGLVVSDRHIPLAASAIPNYAAAVEGSVVPVTYGTKITSQLQTQIEIVKCNS